MIGAQRSISLMSVRCAASGVALSSYPPAAINQRLVLGGPEAISFEEAAGVGGRLLGRQVPVVQAMPGEPASLHSKRKRSLNFSG